MKIKVYVWTKEYDIEYISWVDYKYKIANITDFYEYLNKYDMLKYFVKDKRVKKYLLSSECYDIHNRESALKIIFKVPRKDKKKFFMKWAVIKGTFNKYFYIKEK